MEDFSTIVKLRIDWSEIDLFGHVNNVAILKYVQAARVTFLETIGLMQLQSEAKTGPILASVSCQFCKPMFYPGGVTIYSKVGSIKNTSFEIQHALYDEQNEIAAQAKDIIVFFDFINNAKLRIPNEIREKIENLERKRQ
jgi:acyl-CoA thioester hydrolase